MAVFKKARASENDTGVTNKVTQSYVIENGNNHRSVTRILTMCCGLFSTKLSN